MRRRVRTQMNAGVALLNRGEFQPAIEMLSMVIDSGKVDAEERAKALNLRGFARFRLGDVGSAASDWRTVMDLPTVSTEVHERAHQALERIHGAEILAHAQEALEHGEVAEAITKFRSVLDGSFHEFDRLIAAQTLLEIAEISDDLRQQAHAVIDGLLPDSS